MSQLEELCRTLDGIDADIVRMASHIAQKSQGLSNAGRTIVALSGQERNAQLTTAVIAVDAAAQACRHAARLLEETSRLGQNFIAQHVGGAASGSAASNTASVGRHSDSSAVDQKLLDSFPTTNSTGRCFLPKDDPLVPLAPSIPAVTDGSYLTVVHGNSQEVGVGNTSLSASGLAALIRMDSNYSPGQSITLFSCSTGAEEGGFAQQLADELGARVAAPTDSIWLPPDPDGSVIISPHDSTGHPQRGADGRGLGGWRVFEPN